jgi:IMP cyclohydrolase
MRTLSDILQAARYPGRGIALGVSPDGLLGIAVYFVTGRSEGSRNRVLTQSPDGVVRTQVYDEGAERGDASLTLYNAVRFSSDVLVVSNGRQTDDLFTHDEPISHILSSWDYEHDALCTPRISGLLSPTGESILAIVKASDGSGSESVRYSFEYPRIPGEARFISVYGGDEDSPNAFEGEPIRIAAPLDHDALWNALDSRFRVALYFAKFPLGGTPWNSDTVSTHIRNRHQ